MSRISYLDLLKTYPDYRRLWLGGVVSFLGDWFNTVALYTAVQGISDDARAVAAVMVAKMLPPFLVSPFTGPIVDRFDRRRLLIFLDLLRAAGVLGLVVSHQAGSLWGLYGFTVLMMAAGGMDLPAKNAVLPMLIPNRHVPIANALGGGTWSFMLAFGAMAGGIAVASLGITISFFVDSATFLVSAWIFAGLPSLPAPGRDRKDTRFVDGLRYLVRTPYVLALTCLKPAMGLMGGVLVLIPIYGASFRNEPVAVVKDPAAFWIGLLYGARGLGALTGALGLRMVVGDTPRTLRRTIVGCFILAGTCYGSLGWAEDVYVIATLYMLAAVGSSGIWVFSGTLLQLDADRAFHGRIFSLEFGVMTLVMAAMSWLTGDLLERGWTLADVTLLTGGLAMTSALGWGVVLFLTRRRIRQRVEAKLAAAYESAANEAYELARWRESQQGAERAPDARDPEAPGAQ